MILFKTIHDLENLNTTSPFYGDIRKHISDLPGYIVLIEEEDIHQIIDLPELKCRLEGISWEGVSKSSGYYHAVYLTNNEFALEFIIPDADWLTPELRQSLETHRV